MARYDQRRRHEDDQSDRHPMARDIRRHGPRGLDPNFREGIYHGERMLSGREERAPYGLHRVRNAGDLTGPHGYDEIYRGYELHPAYRRGIRYDSGVRGYDRSFSVRDRERAKDPRAYLRDFNANSAGLREPGGDRGLERWNWGGERGPRRGTPGAPDASAALRDEEGFNPYSGGRRPGFSEMGVVKIRTR